MKKKAIATLLIGSMLLMPLPVFADEKKIVTVIKFDEIAELVKQHNPTAKIYNNQILLSEKNLAVQKDSIRSNINSEISKIDASILEVQGNIAFYNSLIQYYEGLNSPQYDPLIQIYKQAVTQLEASEAQLKTVRSNISYNWSSFEEIERETRQNVVDSVQMGLNAQIYTLQKMYLTYNATLDTLEDLRNQYLLLEENNRILKLQKELGFVTDTNIKQLELTLNQLKDGIDASDRGLKTIIGNMNIFLGQDYDTILELGNRPVLENEKLASMDYDKDYKTAKDNNYNIKMKFNSRNSANKKIDKLSGNEKEIAELELENIDLEFQDLLRKFDLSFKNTYQAVLDAKKTLESQEKEFDISVNNWRNAELKHSLGMLSSIDLLKEKVAYESAYLKYKKAQQALYEAYLNYEWLLKGMEFTSTAGASASAMSSSSASFSFSGGY